MGEPVRTWGAAQARRVLEWAAGGVDLGLGRGLGRVDHDGFITLSSNPVSNGG